MSDTLQQVIFALIPVILLAVGFWILTRRRLHTDTPTSKVKGVFLGLNELQGVVEHRNPLLSRLAKTPCVWFEWKIEEERTKTTTSTSSDGKTTTSTTTEWVRIAGGKRTRPSFALRDDTGAIRVQLKGARVEPATVMSETRRVRGGLLNLSSRRRRYTERAIPVGHDVYLLGPARLRDDIVAPEIAASRSVGPLVVSTRTLTSIVRRYAWFSVGLIVAALGAAGWAGHRIVAGADADSVSVGGVIAGVAVTLLVVLLGWVWLDYNSLVRVRQSQERALSLVDVQLQRRRDLIPQLVKVVAASATHEHETQTLAAAARVEMPPDLGPASVPDAEGDVARRQTRALREVLAVAEGYPELTADEGFTALHAELVDTEDRIALARTFFNDSVTALRNRSQAFPTNLVARLGPFNAADHFLAEGFERSTPEISLSDDVAIDGAEADEVEVDEDVGTDVELDGDVELDDDMELDGVGELTGDAELDDAGVDDAR